MIVRPLQKSISEIRKRGCLYRYHIAIFLMMIQKISLFSIGAVRLICFYSNWLNYFIYQKTPYDLNELEPLGTAQ